MRSNPSLSFLNELQASILTSGILTDPFALCLKYSISPIPQTHLLGLAVSQNCLNQSNTSLYNMIFPYCTVYHNVINVATTE